MTLKSPHIKEQKENDENEEDLKSKEDEESSKEVAKAKRKAIYKMLWNEIKLEMGNIMIGCVCLIGSTASNAGKSVSTFQTNFFAHFNLIEFNA